MRVRALALSLVAALRWLVPGECRARWHAEWRAEILASPTRPLLSARRALAALPHALALRRRHWTIETMLQDLKYAVRQTRSAPALGLTVIATLALGIGANALVYSVLSTTVLNPLPVPDADRVVQLWRQHPDQGFVITPSAELVEQWREQVDGLESLELIVHGDKLLTGYGEPTPVEGAYVSPGLFDLLRTRPRLGRTFDADEIRTNPNLVVLSHGFWAGRLNADPGIVGQTLQLDDEPFVVIGVMPAELRLSGPFLGTSVWMPLPAGMAARGGTAIGRMAAGTSIEALNAELAGIVDPQGGGTAWRGVARSSAEMLSVYYRNAVWTLQAAVASVLLIAVFNIANLLLAQGTSRARELALRSALGASRGRIVRQLLMESAILSTIGGAAGLGLAIAGLRAVSAFRPESVSSLEALRLEPDFALAVLLLTSLTALGVGLLPALQATLGARLDVAAGSGRSGTATREKRYVRASLVVAQVALSTILLVGGGLLISAFLRLDATDSGIAPQTVSMHLSLPQRYDQPADRAAVWAQFEGSVQSALGADTVVAFAAGPPPRGGVDFGALETEGGPVSAEAGGQTMVAVYWVHGDYLEAMGIDLIEGRALVPDDLGEAVSNVLVNAEFARSIAPGESALGKRYRMGGDDDAWNTVVGVVGDVRAFGLMTTRGAHQAYYPMTGRNGVLDRKNLYLIVRSSRSPGEVATTVRGVLQQVEPDIPMTDLATNADRMADTIALPRFNAILVLGLAGAALLLAVVGIYGVVSYTVARRTREMGVRLALGAPVHSVRGVIARQGAGLIGLGLGLGGLGAYAMARTLASVLYGVVASDLVAYALAVAVLGATGLLAIWIPATRATRIDPMVALRTE